jgi:hypothetical protein
VHASGKTPDDRSAAAAHDRVTSCLLESALTLTIIVRGEGIVDEVAVQLPDEIEQLDAAVNELQGLTLNPLAGS